MKSLFGKRRPVLIGMIHLPALPGAPRAGMSIRRIAQTAVEDAALLAKHGFDAVMIENYGDLPFFPDCVPTSTVAAMSVIASHVRQAVAIPIGINVLRNDAVGALSVATAAECDFIRVNVHSGVMLTDQGMISGKAAETMRMRHQLNSSVSIFADVHVKHAAPLSQPDLAESARDTAYRGLADALIVSGQATGTETNADDIQTVRQAVPDRLLLIGSGVTAANLPQVTKFADGVIVGTSLKRGGKTEARLDPKRIDRMVTIARG